MSINDDHRANSAAVPEQHTTTQSSAKHPSYLWTKDSFTESLWITMSKRQKTYDNTADGCKQCKKLAAGSAGVLWENEHYVVIHKGPPCGVVGHLLLLARRHFQGPSSMTDAEASAVGLALKRCEAALEQVTGCDRVYTAALGSATSGSHFHAHMMPLYVEDGAKPKHVTGTPFDLFLQEKLAADFLAGSTSEDVTAAPGKITQVANAFRELMREDDAAHNAAVDEEREDR